MSTSGSITGVSGADAGNYNTPDVTSLTGAANVATIGKADYVSIAGNKSYNGSADFLSSQVTLTGVNGETFNVAATANSANASSNLTDPATDVVSTSGSITGVSGADVGNYNTLDLTSLTGTKSATITPATLIASLTGTVEKTFDGNTIATLVASNYDLSGRLYGSDTVTLNAPTTGSYDTPYGGAGKTVTVTGLTLLGGDSSNYVLSATTISGPVGIIDGPPSGYSTSQYGSSGNTGNPSTVNISFQNEFNTNTPVITAVSQTASNTNQNIATGSGRNSLFTPFSQFDPNQYTNGTLPDFAPQAGEAAVLTMIARAEENNRKAPKINALWQTKVGDWPSGDSVLKNVSFGDGNGHDRTPSGNNGFPFKDGTTDIASLLQHGPVMLGGAASGGQPTPWLLALKTTADGKGIIANDPLTGGQVIWPMIRLPRRSVA